MAPRSVLSLALALAAAAALAAPALGTYCPRFQCPTNRVDSLNFLSTETPIATPFSDVRPTATPATWQECKAACPCKTRYFALIQESVPRSTTTLKYTCYCYATCNNGTFTGRAGRGAPGIRHGYICEGVCNDPHFVGAHGTRYDFNGELDKSFCLVTDKAVHLNAFFKGYKTEETTGATVLADGKGLRTWMSQLGLLWASAAGTKHSLRLVAANKKDLERGDGFLESVTLDGAAVAVPKTPGQVVKVADMALAFIGTFRNTWGAMEDKFILTVGDKLEMALHLGPARPVFHLPGDSMVHFSFNLQSINPTPAIHGVLGQTYRNTAAQLLKAVKYSALDQLLHHNIEADGESGKGFLDGKMQDYTSSDLLAADCAMSAFQ